MDHDLHLPSTGSVTTAAIVVHPHPAMGGDRHHPLVVAVADGLTIAGVAALRVDLRDPDVALSARAIETVAAGLLRDTGADRVVLVGYSWGAAVAAMATPAGLVARVLVAPPVTMLEPDVASALRSGELPALVLVPAHDQYGPPDSVRALLGDTPHATIEVVDGTDHFLAGAVARIATRAVAWISEQR
ncbi:MAG: alpha/beta fold hydrolase [Acidimicrobiales bacterium]